MTVSEIAAEVSAAVDQAKWKMIAEGKVFPVRQHRPTCRWCNSTFTQWTEPQWKRMGYCSRSCVEEKLGGSEHD